MIFFWEILGLPQCGLPQCHWIGTLWSGCMWWFGTGQQWLQRSEQKKIRQGSTCHNCPMWMGVEHPWAPGILMWFWCEDLGFLRVLINRPFRICGWSAYLYLMNSNCPRKLREIALCYVTVNWFYPHYITTLDPLEHVVSGIVGLGHLNYTRWCPSSYLCWFINICQPYSNYSFITIMVLGISILWDPYYCYMVTISILVSLISTSTINPRVTGVIFPNLSRFRPLFSGHRNLWISMGFSGIKEFSGHWAPRYTGHVVYKPRRIPGPHITSIFDPDTSHHHARKTAAWTLGCSLRRGLFFRRSTWRYISFI